MGEREKRRERMKISFGVLFRLHGGSGCEADFQGVVWWRVAGVVGRLNCFFGGNNVL